MTTPHAVLEQNVRPACAPAPRKVTCLVAAWGLLLVLGFGYLTAYSNAPGEAAAPPLQWPADSEIARADKLPNLVMFLHPDCPCSRASIEELARLLTHTPRPVNTTVAIVRPTAEPLSWAGTQVVESVSSIPGVHVFVDTRGAEAHRFGAATSGATMLYGAAGRLQFHGGITAARAHEGDNAGVSAILDWLSTGNANVRETFVFGCPLFASADSTQVAD